MMNSCASSISRSLLPLALLLLVSNTAFCQAEQTTERFTILGLVVEGNAKTRDKVILREVTVAANDILKKAELYAQLERSRQNIMNLGLFNKVTVLPLFVTGNEVLVQIRVDERWFIWPVPIFQLAETNFNTWWLTKDFRRTNYGGYLYWYNLTGNDDRAYMKLQFGYTRQFGLEYESGYFGEDRNWRSETGWSYAENAEVTMGTLNNKRIFRSLPDGNGRKQSQFYQFFTYRPRFNTKHLFGLEYRDASVVDTFALEFSDYFRSGNTRTSFFSLSYQYILDKRDEARFTRDGEYLSLSLRQDGLGILDGSTSLTTAYLQGIHWHRMPQDLTFATSLRYKKTLQNNIPYLLQEGLGYQDFVRGYEFYVVDGQDYLLLKENIHFPIIKPFETSVEQVPIRAFRSFYFAAYLNAFVDAGYVWDDQYADQNFLDNNWLLGYGLGLDIVTSYDRIVRLEYSFNNINENGLFLHFIQPF